MFGFAELSESIVCSEASGFPGPVASDDPSRLIEAFDAVLTIENERVQSFESGGPPGTIGFGHMRFKDRTFYTIKMGNLSRDLAGAAALGGSTALEGLSVWAAIKSGAILAWPGLGTLAAAAIFASKFKSLRINLSFDDATTLALAWDCSTRSHGFQTVRIADIVPRLGDARTIYGNEGYSEAKLRNSLGNLLAFKMIGEAGSGQYQLTEDVRIENGGGIRLCKA